ncbi:TetR/AcrR family transcriptional regulator [Anaerovorax odorimutans]|uniref:TetR/AcrR family transcriptional regulator n=1 Tax=Anaerovorax odorimutans TaxID=109327 RepID=A0ABT1RSQ8_9FIRM|nr:TetR/AcrR family transcriptional regulator [Anaerovorax odorimutans]MCQ4638238.1 TetR/AcrR family transcriptional regulator [Anaerovorax odorimutans]
MSQLTQRAMAASLKKMLAKKTLDKITVKEIADDCGVKRQTFYYHFKDIYDLLEWTFLQEGEQFIDKERICENWQDVYLEVFRYIENNKNFTINAYNSVGREHLERYLYRIVYDLIALFIRGMEGSEKIAKEDRDFICDFYKYALVGIILEWIGGGMKEDPQRISSKLNRLLKRHMEADLFDSETD